MSNSIHRRAWLRQSSLAIAGLTFAGKLAANHATTSVTPDGLLNDLDGILNNITLPIRLTSNENPYGPSPMARKAMAEAVATSNRYPWELTTKLREQIGRKEGLTRDHVLMGAGSSEILGLVAQMAAMKKGNAVTADPTFGIWMPAAEKLGLQLIKVPLTADKKLDLSAMSAKINNDTQLVYVCNPNNPTGTLLEAAAVRNFVESVSRSTLVLLDEAYIEYTDQPTLAGLTASNKNIIVARTFSKIYGLAGARIGYALAHPDTIKQLAAFQPWQNAGASAVSLAAGMASLTDLDFVRSSKEMNRLASAYTIKELKAAGFECIPSETNFIYYSLGKVNGNWSDMLREKNILVGRVVEPNGKWTRTTIGTMDEMKQFISVVKQLI